MINTAFKFYSVLKNEDAMPYISGNLLVAADGLGGSGSTVHAIDRVKHTDMHGDIIAGAFGDMKTVSTELRGYIEELIAPMVDGKDDTSALWASRIVIARCVYALTEGEFQKSDLSDKKVRAMLAEFIETGLHNVSRKFDLQKGKYDGQLLLPTTLACIRYSEKKRSVIAETVWAGDSRCYALLPDGLKLLSLDDEDDSGSITNLFYADNDKVTLNYIRHEIPKPCALLAVSDGIFDPFDPHENLGVEYILLSAIKEHNSPQEVATALYNFYGSIHGDDATLSFVPFGFDSYKDMQNKLAQRTDEIIAVRNKQVKLYGALEVMNQSEEEASHYVLSRTNDRYDYIVPILVDTIESGAQDIALTSTIRKIAVAATKACGESAEKARKQRRAQSMNALYNYVKNNPLCVTHLFVNSIFLQYPNGGQQKEITCLFTQLFSKAQDYNNNNKLNAKLAAKKSELEAKSEAFHWRIMEKISFYRNKFDGMWGDKISDCKLRYNTNIYLRIWQEIDFDLQYHRSVSYIGNLPVADRSLANEIRTYIDDCRKVKEQIKRMRSSGDNSYRSFIEAWNAVYDYLNRCPSAINNILTDQAVQQFGFDISDERFIMELGKNSRNRIISEFKAQKEVIVSDIVKSLSENCDKISVIDGQYNATRLELFRTYYRLKSMDSGELKAFESQLAKLETEYNSLIIK